MLTRLVFILIFIVFYFILSEGLGVGSIPLVAPRAAAGMKPTQPRSQEKQLLWVPLGSHILGCYLASEVSQCSLFQTLRPAHAVMSLSCLALCWET